MNTTFSIREALLFGFSSLIVHYKLFVGIFLSMIGVGSGIRLLGYLSSHMLDVGREPLDSAIDWFGFIAYSLIMLTVFVISYGISLGILQVSLDIATSGSSTVKRLFSRFSYVPLMTVASVIFWAFVGIVAFILYVPFNTLMCYQKSTILCEMLYAYVWGNFIGIQELGIAPTPVRFGGRYIASTINQMLNFSEFIVPAILIVTTLFGFYLFYLLERKHGIVDSFVTSFALARKALFKLVLLYAFEIIILSVFLLLASERFACMGTQTCSISGLSLFVMGLASIAGLIMMFVFTMTNAYAYKKLAEKTK